MIKEHYIHYRSVMMKPLTHKVNKQQIKRKYYIYTVSMHNYFVSIKIKKFLKLGLNSTFWFYELSKLFILR
jgi:hypothetical protein